MKWQINLAKKKEKREEKLKLERETREQKRALAKQMGANHFALTGNFGY